MNAELEAAKREIVRLQKVIELQKHALDRYRPCSDHNGKVNPLHKWQCQWCRVERAEHKVARLNALLEATESREDSETCPDCGGVIFDNQCRCAEIDAKIYDQLNRGD